MSLINETKIAMRYKDSADTCEKCKHCNEMEDPNVDRTFVLICSYSNICSFRVERLGSCSKFEACDA